MRRCEVGRGRLVTVIVTSLAAASCATPAQRFSKAVGYATSGSLRAFASLDSSPGASAAPTMLKDLPERAAAAYITALAAKTKTVVELQVALGKPLGGGGAQGGDVARLSRSLLITVSSGCDRSVDADCPPPQAPRQFPGDRLTYIEVWVQPLNFAFSDIPATATTWASQTIDTRDVNNDLKVQPELDATLAGTVKGTFKSPVSYDHQVDVKATDTEPYRLPTINLRSGSIVLEATGSRSVDLVGSATIKANIVPPASTAYDADPSALEDHDVASNLSFGSPGDWLPEAKASISVTRIRSWRPTALIAKLFFWYGVRHIKSGVKTYPEDDDEVQYLDLESGPRCVVVATPYEIASPLWELLVRGAPFGMKTDAGVRPVVFGSMDDAQIVAGWLASGDHARIGKRRIGGVGAPVGSDAGERRLVPVRRGDEIVVVNASPPVPSKGVPTCEPEPIASAEAPGPTVRPPS